MTYPAKLGLGLSLALFLAIPGPAGAAPLAADGRADLGLASNPLSNDLDRRALPDPEAAAGLSWMVPLGLAAASFPVGGPVALLVGPMGAGAGHFYAGDPARGTLFTIGGLVVPALGLGLGLGLASANPTGQSLGSLAVASLAGGLISAVGYTLFASRDAYDTARRQR